MVKNENSPPEFTPADIAAVAGVSVSLQREWRRQEILPKKQDRGWTRVGLAELVRIYALKRLADAGIPLKLAQEASHKAAAPLLDAVAEHSRDAELFWFWVQLQNEMTRTAKKQPRHSPTTANFTIVWTDQGDRHPAVHVKPVASLSDVPENLIVWTALDNRRAADHITRAVSDRLVGRGG